MMAHLLIHKDGAFNLYSTVVDAPIFDRALTEEQVRQLDGFSGDQGDRYIEMAKAKGSASRGDTSLQDVVAHNRAGPAERRLSMTAFVTKYLTLPKPESLDQQQAQAEALRRENPLNSIAATLAFTTRDNSLNHRDAWIYGIVIGWDDEALAELIPVHHWTPETVARLKRLRARYEQLGAIMASTLLSEFSDNQPKEL